MSRWRRRSAPSPVRVFLSGDAAARAAGGYGRRRAELRARDRRVRRDDDGRRKHSRVDANARGRDLFLCGNRPRTRGGAARVGVGGARLSGPVAVELDHQPRRRPDMITLCVRAAAGDFDLRLKEQLAPGITALFGPSGSGKTTTLDAIAGLRTPSSGLICHPRSRPVRRTHAE